MSRKMPMGGHRMLGALLVLVAALLALAGCAGGGEEDGSNPPPSPEEASSVIVRVSGTEGVAYAGNYGTFTREPQIVDDTLGSEPEEYEVEVEQGTADGVSASFQKVEPGAGRLKAEIVADGEVVTESTTYAELGSVIVDWLPQAGPLPGEIPPEEFFEEPMPEERDLP